MEKELDFTEPKANMFQYRADPNEKKLDFTAPPTAPDTGTPEGTMKALEGLSAAMSAPMRTCQCGHARSFHGTDYNEDCSECHCEGYRPYYPIPTPNTGTPQVTGGMEERLQVEVMEDYLLEAKFPTGKDGTHKEIMREYFEKLKNFIRQEISLALTHDRARLVEEVEAEKYTDDEEDLGAEAIAEHAYKDKFEAFRYGYNEALQRVLTLLKDKGG